MSNVTRVPGKAYPVLHEFVKTLADTAITPAWSEYYEVLWVEVFQHPDYGDVKISTGSDSTPTATNNVTLQPRADNLPHDLSSIQLKAAANGDKVIVRYERLEYYNP